MNKGNTAARGGRNYYIEILRVIGTIGVFTGHFLGIGIASNTSLEIVSYLRNSWTGRSMLSYLFEGDIAVIFFYVASGFFISYLYNDEMDNFAKLFKQTFAVLIPTLVMLFIHVTYIMVDKMDISQISILISDIKSLFCGGNIQSSYQLWYIHYLIVGYAIVYSGLSLTKTVKQKFVFMLILICFTFCININVCQMMAGALFGILSKKVNWHKRFGRHKCMMAIIVSGVTIPIIYNEHCINIFTIFIAGVLFCIIISIITSIDNSEAIRSFSNIYIVKMALRNTFSVYLVHSLIISIIGKFYLGMVDRGIINDAILALFAFYIVSVVITMIAAELYNKYVICNSKKLINCVYMKYIK